MKQKNENPYILIMAGGSGTRLWPLSRQNHPKQLLTLFSKYSLIEETINRALLLTKRSNIYIGTNKEIRDSILKVSHKIIPKKNFILEPKARNTAPIITLFVQILAKRKKDMKRPIVVLSADHHISPAKKWAEFVQKSFEYADKKIWCLGIEPKHPDTGFGYIEIDTPIDLDLYKIKAFNEKPDISTAKKYVESKRFLWNSGMFIFSGNRFQRELQLNFNEIYEIGKKCIKSKKHLKKHFKKMPNISFDYAILEKSKNLGVIRANFNWNDVGSYSAIETIKGKDKQQNYSINKDKYSELNSKNNFISNDDKNLQISLLGVKDLVIVKNKNVLFIANKNNIQDIKELREKVDEKYL